MKKSNVILGSHYVTNVSGKRTVVRIMSERKTGWNAVNLLTGRNIVIGNATRLHYEVMSFQLQALLDIFK